MKKKINPWIIWYGVPLLNHIKHDMMRKKKLMNPLTDQDFTVYLLKQVALTQPNLYTKGTERSCNLPRVMRLVSG